MKEYYITSGDVRGDCPHRHRSLEAAERCLRRDQLGCRSQGGYSDRRIYRVVVGERRVLWVDDERE